MDYRSELSPILRDFLTYHETIRGHSKKTVDEYFFDLRTFFRYIKLKRGLVPQDSDFECIGIADVDLALIRSIQLSDVYDYLLFLSRDRARRYNSPQAGTGLNAAARARKIASIRSLFKYLCVKVNLLENNPVQDLDAPKPKKTLPRYLTLDESVKLLESVDGAFRERDYCILTLFLNCGLRISELAGLNLYDIQADTLRVTGKGNKERILYLNEACLSALESYRKVRFPPNIKDKNALFITRNHTRINVKTVNYLVKKHLGHAGLDPDKYSAHKLRHTAATLMLKGGVDVRTLQELLGHDHLNTTQIYTHVNSEDLKKAALANPLSGVRASGKKE